MPLRSKLKKPIHILFMKTDYSVREVLRRSQSLVQERSLQELYELATSMADELQDSQYDGPEEENSQASTLDGFKSPEALVDRKSSPSSQAALQLLRMVNAKIAKEKAAKENEASHGCLIHGARFVSCHLIRRVSSFAQGRAQNLLQRKSRPRYRSRWISRRSRRSQGCQKVVTKELRQKL